MLLTHPSSLTRKKISMNDDQISIDLIEERIGANLETLNEQIWNATQLINQLIWDSSAKTTPTAGSRTHRAQTGPSLEKEPGTSRTARGMALGAMRATCDTGYFPTTLNMEFGLNNLFRALKLVLWCRMLWFEVARSCNLAHFVYMVMSHNFHLVQTVPLSNNNRLLFHIECWVT